MEKDTIAAIATPLGSSGIGIIRMSGSSSLAIAQALFRPSGQGPPTAAASGPPHEIPAYQLKYGHIYEPGSDRIVDEVLISYMKAPKSYTREDVVEIQSHGGPVVLRKLIDLIIECGARLAEPGEFTKRAFLNGRIDLSQAEAVAEVISAKSYAALQLGTNQLAGKMKTVILAFIDRIVSLQAEVEARIDFCEDIENQAPHQNLRRTLQEEIIEPVSKLIEDYRKGHYFRDGLRMDIVGRPNVGKSSLLNQLVKKDKAIVTPIPGTTRDLVEDYFCIGGIPILITDTAGLHPTDDPIEIIGIQKTRENISRSDLVLFVIDGSQPLESFDQDIYEQINAQTIILVVNKNDLLMPGVHPVLPEKFRDAPTVMVSALNGDGITELEHTIQQTCLNGTFIDPGRDLIPTLRQRGALERALVHLNRALEETGASVPEELIAENLEQAKQELRLILGDEIDRDMLDEIFSRFCIGK
jgi:tRNA modification GTPase